MKVRTYIVSSFAKGYAIQLAPPKKHCIFLESLFFSCRVSLAEYNWLLRVLSHPVAGVVLCPLMVVTKCQWAQLSCICFSSMLLLEDVIWASNIISNLCYCKHFKAFLFFLNQVLNSVLSYYSSCKLWVCDMYLLNQVWSWLWSWFIEAFVVLDGLPGLYKWRYARVNVFNGDRHT